MAKKNIHPLLQPMDIYCNGKFLFSSKGITKKLTVDIWAGNHPFYTQKKDNFMDIEGQISRFNKKYIKSKRDNDNI